jgi:hypothetical protein
MSAGTKWMKVAQMNTEYVDATDQVNELITIMMKAGLISLCLRV